MDGASPLEVVVVVHHHADGLYGAEAVTRQLVRCWRGDGHAVNTLSFDDLPDLLQRGRLAPLVFPWFVAWRLRRCSADLVEATTGDTWLLARRWRSRRVRPFLAVRSHGLEQLAERSLVARAKSEGRRLSWLRQAYFAHWRLWEVAASLRSADAVRVLNLAERRLVEQELHVAPERVLPTRNGVDEAFRSVASTRSPQEFAVAVVGRWSADKGKQDVLETWRAVRDQLPRVRLRLLGVGVSAAPSALAGVDVQETLTPHAMASALSSCHAYLSHSTSEGYSLALAEAMATGCVPVVTDVGAARELVVTGACGVVFPVGDVPAAVKALVQLAEDPEQRAKLSERAVAAVAQDSWENVARTALDDCRALGLAASGPRRRTT